MIEVIEVIMKRQNLEYQSNEENYKTFILMCHMPFLSGIISWGTSIRTSWIGADAKIGANFLGDMYPAADFLNILFTWLNE